MLTSFQVNGIELIAPNGSNGVFLQYPIEGLDAPEYRVSSYNRAGQDGGVLTTPFYGVRDINITGKLSMQSPAQYETARKLLLAAFGTNRDANGNIIRQIYQVTTLAGQIYYFLGQAKQPKFALDQMNWTKFMVEILAGDPNLYMATGNTSYTVVNGDTMSSIAGAHGLTLSQLLLMNPQVTNPSVLTPGQALLVAVPQTTGQFQPPQGGGFPVPTLVPTISTLTGLGSVTANNAGNILTPPVIILRGPLTTPFLFNSTLGISMQLGYTLGGGDTVIIDMLNKTIMLNGNTSLLGYKSTSSDWWGLAPGPNVITLSSGNVADTGTAEVTWFNAVSGI